MDGVAIQPGLTLRGITTLKVSTPGSTYTPPAGVRALFVEVQGGGGGGAGAQGGSGTAAVGGSAGGGGYWASLLTSLAALYDFYVGAGGAGGVGNNAGDPGDSSYFRVHGSMDGNLAYGGNGGGAMSAGTTFQMGYNAPGGNTDQTADIFAFGGPGSPSTRYNGTTGLPGNGGSRHFGPGALGNTVYVSAAHTGEGDGGSGVGFGDGGAGAASGNTTSRTGGSGSPGIIRIWEFY